MAPPAHGSEVLGLLIFGGTVSWFWLKMLHNYNYDYLWKLLIYYPERGGGSKTNLTIRVQYFLRNFKFDCLQNLQKSSRGVDLSFKKKHGSIRHLISEIQVRKVFRHREFSKSHWNYINLLHFWKFWRQSYDGEKNCARKKVGTPPQDSLSITTFISFPCFVTFSAGRPFFLIFSLKQFCWNWWRESHLS